MVALMITAIALLTLQAAMQLFDQRARQRTDEQLAWHYLLGEIESTKYQFRLKNINSARIELIETTGKKRLFFIERNKMNIILTTKYGGYMPLMLNVRRLEYHVKQQRLQLMVTTASQQKFSAVTSVTKEDD